MKKLLHIKFKDVNSKNIRFKKLGIFFEKNTNFYIELSINQSYKEKVITLLEELLHFVIRVILTITKKKLSVPNEHKLIKHIITLFTTENIL